MLRHFFQPKSFDWTLATGGSVACEFGFLKNSAAAPTAVLIPSLSLTPSKEEWRACARKLHELGFNAVLLELPGFSLTQGALNATLLQQDRPLDALRDFIAQFLTFLSDNTHTAPICLVAAGGQSSALAAQAIYRSPQSENFRFISLAPIARQYLRVSVPEGFDQRFARKQARVYRLLSDHLVSRKLFQKIVYSPWFIRRHAKNCDLFEAEISAEQLVAHQLALRRPAVDLHFQAAVYCGYLDAVHSTNQLLQSIMFLEQTDKVDNPFDTDDEDELIFHGRSLPVVQKPKFNSWRATQLTRQSRIIISDASSPKLLEEAASHFRVPTVRVYGKLHCHEEFPSAVAEAIASLVKSS